MASAPHWQDLVGLETIKAIEEGCTDLDERSVGSRI